jgi:hypothetical protein
MPTDVTASETTSRNSKVAIGPLGVFVSADEKLQGELFEHEIVGGLMSAQTFGCVGCACKVHQKIQECRRLMHEQ